MHAVRSRFFPAGLLLVLLPALGGCPADPPPAQAELSSSSDAGDSRDAAGSGVVSAPRGPAPAAPGREPSASQSRSFVLRSGIDGFDPESPPTLHFEGEDRIAGSSGCNQYSAGIERSDGGVRIGPVAATKRGCPGARGRAEPAFFAALSSVEAIERSDARIVLRRGDGGPPLVFEADASG